jgi:DNA-binding PadR family transcriptional regulator
MRELSDLELVVLGIVWKRGPCTPYVIRKEFATSPSSHWRGSTGAIYPLVLRLASQHYLKTNRTSRGRRASTCCSLLPKGLREIRRWLLPPIPEEAAAVTYDPLRSRVPYLGVLTTAERLAFLREAERALREQIPHLEKRLESYMALGDQFGALSVKGARRLLQARLEWIIEMQTERALRLPRMRSGEISPRGGAFSPRSPSSRKRGGSTRKRS